MHTTGALLCFEVVRHWTTLLISTRGSSLLRGNRKIQDHVYEKRVKGYLANSMHYLWREKRQMSDECENHIYIYIPLIISNCIRIIYICNTCDACILAVSKHQNLIRTCQASCLWASTDSLEMHTTSWYKRGNQCVFGVTRDESNVCFVSWYNCPTSCLVFIPTITVFSR